MGVHVVSLIATEPQEIPPSAYTIVRFPYVGESSDAWGMHAAEQPDGVVSAFPDERSGLIWPAVAGWGSLTAMVYWANGDYSEVRDRFVRAPLNVAGEYDSTATEDHAPTQGGQYRHKCHELFVRPGTPLGFLVRHNASVPVSITHAQFKLAIHPVVTPDGGGC